MAKLHEQYGKRYSEQNSKKLKFILYLNAHII